MKFMEKKSSMEYISRKGQVMLVSILTLGGIMIGVTAISGLLVLYQIRMSSDAAGSAKAIFASDAGVDWALYRFLKSTSGFTPDTNFSNGAVSTVVCKGPSGILDCSDANISSIVSTGVSGSIYRVFQLDL